MKLYDFNKFNENNNIIAAKVKDVDGWKELKFTDDEFYYDFFKKWYLDKHYLGMDDGMEVYVDTIETDYYDYDVIIKVDRIGKVIYTKELEKKYKIEPRDKNINMEQEMTLRVRFLEQVWYRNRVEKYEIKDGIIYVYLIKDKYNNFEGSIYKIDKNGDVIDISNKNEDYIFDKPIIKRDDELSNPTKSSSFYVLNRMKKYNDNDFKKILDNIADALNVKIKNYINAGSTGYTFELMDGKVLKLTNDGKEAINTAYIISQSNIKKFNHIAKYFSVNLLNFKEHDLSLYAIIMEKLEPISSKDVMTIKKYHLLNQYIKNKNDIKDIIVKISKKVPYINDKDEIKLTRGIIDMYTEMYNRNIIFSDLHKNNIAYDVNGNLVAYDNGYNTVIDQNSISDYINIIDL